MPELVKKRLGEILIENGVLTPENLEEALNHQKREGGLIGQILIRMGYISEENLIAAIGKQLRVPYLPLSQYAVNSEAAEILGEDFCRKNLLMGFDQDDKRIFLALSDPLNTQVLLEIQKKTNLKPQVFISTPTEILNMMDLVFSAAKRAAKKAG